MARKFFLFAATIGCLGVGVPFALAQESDATNLTEQSDSHVTIEKALPYIAEQGRWWMTEKKCMSCHRVSLTAWALRDAAQHNFDVDKTDLQDIQNWSESNLFEINNDNGKPTAAGNLEGLSHVLWSGLEIEQTKVADLLQLYVESQSKEGLWAAGGQLPQQKRLAAETQMVSTMWNSLALKKMAGQNDVLGNAAERAVNAIEKSETGKSTEWFVLRLLLDIQNHSDNSPRDAEKLRGLQNSDGGWGWLVGEQSDALATGMAIYGLSFPRGRSDGEIANEKKSIDLASKFLSSTQQPDGSWKVNGTKSKAQNSTTETASYWGTCWAVIGLLSTYEN